MNKTLDRKEQKSTISKDADSKTVSFVAPDRIEERTEKYDPEKDTTDYDTISGEIASGNDISFGTENINDDDEIELQQTLNAIADAVPDRTITDDVEIIEETPENIKLRAERRSQFIYGENEINPDDIKEIDRQPIPHTKLKTKLFPTYIKLRDARNDRIANEAKMETQKPEPKPEPEPAPEKHLTQPTQYDLLLAERRKNESKTPENKDDDDLIEDEDPPVKNPPLPLDYDVFDDEEEFKVLSQSVREILRGAGEPFDKAFSAIKEKYPNMNHIYSSADAKRPIKWRVWDDKTGYYDVEFRVMQSFVYVMFKFMYKKTSKKINNDTLAFWNNFTKLGGANETSSVDKDWQNADDVLVLQDGVRGICLKTHKIIDITKDHKTMIRLPVYESQIPKSQKQYEKSDFHKWLTSRWFRPDLNPDEANDIETLRFLCGMALKTNSISAILYLFGDGGTGKTAFLNCIHTTMGAVLAYEAHDQEYLSGSKLKKNTHPTSSEHVRLSKYSINGEVGGCKKTTYINLGNCKENTGGGKKEGRGMYENSSNFHANTFVLLAGNFVANIADEEKDYSFERRFFCVKFRHRQLKYDNVFGTDTMDKAVEKEKGNILYFLLSGLKDFNKLKNQSENEIPVSTEMKKFKASIMREEESFTDHLNNIITEGKKSDFVPIKDIRENLIKTQPSIYNDRLSAIKLSKLIGKTDFEYGESPEHGRQKGIFGFNLKKESS